MPQPPAPVRLKGRTAVTWTVIGLAMALAAMTACAGWAYLTRQRLARRVGDLSQELELRASEMESVRMQLMRQSTEDSLTAVANHEQFLDFLEREWRRSRRDGLPLSIVFVDLDHFRAFNRQYGRRAGDDCLRQVGQTLATLVGRPGDLVARYHRDEFGVLLAGTDGQGAVNLAERIRQAVEDLKIPAAKDAGKPCVTASVSLATAVPMGQSTWEELDLIKAARHALREARSAGGNRVLRADLGLSGPPELVGT
jgi:diguanylate cyclase (GGDEF)-like protein